MRLLLTVLTGILAATVLWARQGGNPAQPMGLGMASPDVYNQPALYFYGPLTPGKTVQDHAPADSVTFRLTELGVEVATAPPWFAPAHLKLDYDVLWLRVVSIQPDFLEVVVNEHTDRTAFVDRYQCDLLFWPEFLLSIHSVEALDRAENPVRVKPLDNAGLVHTPYTFLKPRKITDEWVYVELLTNDLQSLGTGWIRWRHDGKLLISYSLFS